MYEARWQNSTPTWIPVDVMEAARLLQNHPQGSRGALDALSEGRKSVAVAYVAEHPAETDGYIEVRAREAQPYTRPTPQPEPDGDVLFA